jgi:hypothetical protein
MLCEGIANLKEKVQRMQPEDFMIGAKSLADLKNPEIHDMPIRILDSLIDNEEKGNNGFSVFNRGQQLKTSLIDANRVKAFIDQQQREQCQQRLAKGAPKKRGKAKERLQTKTTTQDDPAWNNMMEFFKANPAALMDAFPTPPGSDLGDDPVVQNRQAQMDFTMTKSNKRDPDTVS